MPNYKPSIKPKRMKELDTLSDEELRALYTRMKALKSYDRYNKLETLFPDKGTDGTQYGFDEHGEPINPDGETWSRHLYQKQLDFFTASKDYFYILLGGGSRSGKTMASAYITTCHVTGLYPEWYKGRRFNHPIDCWVVGKDNKVVVDNLQNLLCGPVGDFGTGLIPSKCLDHESLGDPKKAQAGLGKVRIFHKSGGISTIGFKTYDAGFMSFESWKGHLIWLDEEPPAQVLTSCIARLTTTNGLLYMSYTPLAGVSETIDTFFGNGVTMEDGPVPGDKGIGKYVVRVKQTDIPHMTEAARLRSLAAYPEYERLARSEGVPALGSGVVYNIDLSMPSDDSPSSSIVIKPIDIPDSYRIVFGIDFGWEDPTAILWAAIDPITENIYIFAEHYRSKAPVESHAAAINTINKLMKFKIPGVADPSGGGTSIADGKHTADVYRDNFEIIFQNANNRIRPGIQETLLKFNSGKLKIFSTCTNLIKELKHYRYEGGKLKGADHACDALRYIIVSGLKIAKSKSDVDYNSNREFKAPIKDESDWENF